jgi:hypothetical protein
VNHVSEYDFDGLAGLQHGIASQVIPVLEVVDFDFVFLRDATQ